MSVFLEIMAAVFNFFKFELTLYGHTFSFWDIIMFDLFAGVLIGFVVGVIRER